MLRPLNLFQVDKHGQPLTDAEGKPVVLPERQQRPKTDKELSDGDRAMLEHALVYERDKEKRDAKASVEENFRDLMIHFLRERQQAGR